MGQNLTKWGPGQGGDGEGLIESASLKKAVHTKEDYMSDGGPFWESTGMTSNMAGFMEKNRYFHFFQRGLTSADKMRFGKCQMDAKDPPNA